MASAEVLPSSAASSRKQGHLEAGKKRLEEFRKKKAEGRAKKAASTGQLLSADTDSDQYEKFSPNNEHVRDGAKSSADIGPSGLVMAHENKPACSSESTENGSSTEAHASSLILVKSGYAVSGDSVQTAGKEVSKVYESSGVSEPVNGYYDHWQDKRLLSYNNGSKFEPSHAITTNELKDFDTVHRNPNLDMTINHSSSHSFIQDQSGEDKYSSNLHVSNPEMFGADLPSTFEKSGRLSAENSLGLLSTSGEASGAQEGLNPGVVKYHPVSTDHDSIMGSDMGGRKIADSISRHLNFESAHWHASGPSSKVSNLSSKNSEYQNSFPSTGYGTTYGRSRPSFLDSLGVPRVSSTSHVPYGEPENNPPVSFNSSKFQTLEIPSSSSPKQPFAELNVVEQSFKSSTPDFVREKELSMSSVFLNDDKPLKQGFGDDVQRDHESVTPKKDEDFAAVEQHIEDLTQEKFSLQRALDTSRTLAESLASENSSLTDSFNQQGQIVNQLKSDMERLREEIKAQLMAFESVKLEYANAQLECNAADERAKILASEVIGLEEKALRLRSNELKLEKQLENLNFENTSYKRKVSILEKERQDFQSTIDALQEEKKLLHSKLRKASPIGKANDTMKTSSSKRDVSTSTEDLGAGRFDLVDGEPSVAETMSNITINALQDNTLALSTDASNLSLLPELPDASGDIPPDHRRIIDNIGSLISELALEKEELMGALTTESSNCSKLKDLNMELSQKLEAQTQRLEFLTAQRMANENLLPKPIDMHSMQDRPEYADEGDEVVERVLGWIMKLFPGGPAKRRTSKLL